MTAAKKTVVILGAGINGAALARELLLSGVSVVVVDAADIAAGATAWSTRLIHGGLRYLEYGELGLVRESLAERDRLVRLAPHLVQPLLFYLPVEQRLGGLLAAAARLAGWESLARRWRGNRGRGSWTVAIGLTLYDLLSVGSRWPWHKIVKAGAIGLPQVDGRRFPLAGIYSDAQLLFPERFTVELLVDARQIARAAGTQFSVFTHHRARLLPSGTLELTPHGSSNASGPVIEVLPDAIVNATGAWVDRTLDILFDCDSRFLTGTHLTAGTKGSHLIVQACGLREALGDYGIYAEATDGRPIFVLPFGPELVLVGTTDIPFSGDPAAARTDEAEIEYLLTLVRRIFPHVSLSRQDVLQHYCGVRPLPRGGVRPLPRADDTVSPTTAASGPRAAASPAAVTRRHMLVRHASAPLPAWSIVGGKLTTCRSLAESAAAEVLAELGLPVQGTSRERPLPGAVAGASRSDLVQRATDAARQAGHQEAAAAAMALSAVALFGSRSPAAFVAGDARALEMLEGVGLPVSAVGFCVREEWATSLEDVIERRLMLSFNERLSVATIVGVAEELVREKLLPLEQLDSAVAAYVKALRAKYGKRVPQKGGRQ